MCFAKQQRLMNLASGNLYKASVDGPFAFSFAPTGPKNNSPEQNGAALAAQRRPGLQVNAILSPERAKPSVKRRDTLGVVIRGIRNHLRASVATKDSCN